MSDDDKAVQAVRLAADLLRFCGERAAAGLDPSVIATALGLTTGAVMAMNARPGHLDEVLATHAKAVRDTALREIARAAVAQ